MNKILNEDFEQLLSWCGEKRLQSWYGTKWLITGATGMVGSYLLSFLCHVNEYYLDESMQITILHRGKIDLSHPNIGCLLQKAYLRFKKIDLSTEFVFPDLDGYNYIVQGASNAAPKAYLQDPVGTINTNVRASQIFLEAVKESKDLVCFLYISSGEIYGEPALTDVPTSEDYIGLTNHLTERSCYNEAKRFTESLCWNYFKQYHVPIKIVRPVHIFGPGFRQDDSRVWADFIVQAMNSSLINIWGDGLPRRGFCYLSDAILQIVAVLCHGTPGEVYNIGCEQHVSIRDLADIIARNTGTKTTVAVKNELPAYLQGSPQVSCPSIRKVSQLMPLMHTDLETGIKKTIKWFVSKK